MGPAILIEARVTVANMGRRAAQEVVQLYVRDEAGQPAPAAQGAEALCQGSAPAWRGTDRHLHARRATIWPSTTTRAAAGSAKPGSFELLVGPHAADIRQRARFTWRGDTTGPRRPPNLASYLRACPSKRCSPMYTAGACWSAISASCSSIPRPRWPWRCPSTSSRPSCRSLLTDELMQAIQDDLAAD
jgi:hypothetical protein